MAGYGKGIVIKMIERRLCGLRFVMGCVNGVWTFCLEWGHWRSDAEKVILCMVDMLDCI